MCCNYQKDIKKYYTNKTEDTIILRKNTKIKLYDLVHQFLH